MTKTSYYLLVILSILLLGTSCHRALTLDEITDRKDGKLVVLGWGFRTLGLETNVHKVIAEKYGYKVKIVGACMISDSLQKAGTRQNNAVDKILKARYGKDFDSLYWQDFRAELKREQAIKSYIEKIDTLQQRIKNCDTVETYRYYAMTPINDGTRYFVSIQGDVHKENEIEYVSYYRLVIDYPTLKISMSNNKIEKVDETQISNFKFQISV